MTRGGWGRRDKSDRRDRPVVSSWEEFSDRLEVRREFKNPAIVAGFLAGNAHMVQEDVER